MFLFVVILNCDRKVGVNMINTKELAKYLNIHENTVYSLIKRGLPYYKIGKQEFRFELEEVKRWLKQNENKGE